MWEIFAPKKGTRVCDARLIKTDETSPRWFFLFIYVIVLWKKHVVCEWDRFGEDKGRATPKGFPEIK